MNENTIPKAYLKYTSESFDFMIMICFPKNSSNTNNNSSNREGRGKKNNNSLLIMKLNKIVDEKLFMPNV